MDYNEYNYRPDNNGYGQHGQRKKKHSVLIILLIVIGVVVVSVSSIATYLWVVPREDENSAVESAEQFENQQQEEQEQASASASESAKPDTKAASGTSTSYGLATGSASGEDGMTPEEVADKLIPSVVCIQNYQTYNYNYNTYGFNANFWNEQGKNEQEELVLYGEGSGIVLTEDGYIATNAHVISDASILKVIGSDDEVYEATVIGCDTDTDLAVIKIDAKGLVPAKLGDSSELSVGQYVMAIGNPGGMEFSSSVTLGIVSAVNRPLEIDDGGYTMNTIQTDAAINPGNSGGALVNLYGQVVGISSAKYVATGYEGLGFAITINEALPVINDLMDYGYVHNRSMLGVTGVALDSVTAKYYGLVEGFYIYSINNPNMGDLMVGDVIQTIDGKEITSESDVKNATYQKTPGTKISITFYRSSTKKSATTEVTLMQYTTEQSN